MKHTKATTQAQASRAYRLGKINAERLGCGTVKIVDYNDYDDTIEWDALNGRTIFTNCKGEIVSAW